MLSTHTTAIWPDGFPQVWQTSLLKAWANTSVRGKVQAWLELDLNAELYFQPGLLVLTDKLQSKDNTLGALLNDRKLHDELSTTVESADSLFRTILQDGLDVNIDFF